MNGAEDINVMRMVCYILNLMSKKGIVGPRALEALSSMLRLLRATATDAVCISKKKSRYNGLLLALEESVD